MFQLGVYDFDPVAKKYFKSAYSDDELRGIVETNGGDLNVAVSDDPSTEVKSPLNYTFFIGIKPQPSSQKLVLSPGPGKSVVRAWGLPVGP